MTEVATILPTMITKDQNTGRDITWQITFSQAAGPATQDRYGWTHVLGLSRTKGRRAYMVHAVVIGDVIVKHSAPVKAF
jgi:hypothetical protein